MRETSMSDDDLAIESAKTKLVALKDRPGYLEAMRPPPPASAARWVVAVAVAMCGGLAYSSWIYVGAAWLQWVLVVMFAVIGLFFVLMFIGLSASTAYERWGVAVLAKQARTVTVLREDGTRCELTAAELIADALKPGDLGVARVGGLAPNLALEAFERL